MEYIGIKDIKKVGIQKKYSIQNNETDLYEDTPNFLVDGLVSKNSKHACVSKEMRVLTNKGYKKIIDIDKLDRVAYIDKREKLRLAKKYVIIEAGKRKVYKVKTKNGYTIRVTSDHEFFVLTEKGIERKQLRNINIGDKIVVI